MICKSPYCQKRGGKIMHGCSTSVLVVNPDVELFNLLIMGPTSVVHRPPLRFYSRKLVFQFPSLFP